MAKYYSIGIERDGSLEGARREALKGLHGKLHNEHGERTKAEFWRCQRQLAMAILAGIEMTKAELYEANADLSGGIPYAPNSCSTGGSE